MQKSGLVWEIDNVCLFLTYEVPSANSSPFISLCIVYSNIGHRAHKSSPRAAKTAPFVCTVLTDSILCPLTSSLPLPLLSARLCPLKHINRPRLCRAIMFLFLLIIFFYSRVCEERKGQKIYPSTEMHSVDSSLRLQMFLPSMFLPPRVRLFLYVAGMRGVGVGGELSKFMDGFRACLCQRARGAQKVRRNCRRLDTQSDRRAFVRERKNDLLPPRRFK